jgi:ABC-2 type transport system permease protein
MSDASAIHDIGYQRYRGERLGRRYARTSLYTHSLRTAFGLGRSGKAKIFPWFAVAVLLLVAVIVVAVRSQTGRLVLSYVDFPERTALLVLLFLATAAPELVSRDLRSKVLPLYFSRPLHRADYVFAKLAALISGVWLIIALPLLVIFLGGAFSLPADKIWREFTDFLGGLLAAAVMAIVYTVVALLVASLLSRRMVAAAVIVAVFLVTSTVGFAIGAILGGNGERIGRLFGPTLLVQSLNLWLFGGDPKLWGSFGLVYLLVSALLVAVAGVLLLVRYRKVAA